MKHSQLFKQTIVAGATVQFAATGNKLFVRTGAQPFKVKFDNNSEIEVEEGFSFSSDEEAFSRLEVTNPNAASLYVEFYVGDATIERGSPAYMREALTAVGPNSTVIDDLDPGEYSVVFPASSSLGKHRKEMIIGNQNGTSSNEVLILVDGVQIGFIPGGSSFVFPCNVAFQLKASTTNVSACIVSILELVYA